MLRGIVPKQFPPLAGPAILLVGVHLLLDAKDVRHLLQGLASCFHCDEG